MERLIRVALRRSALGRDDAFPVTPNRAQGRSYVQGEGSRQVTAVWRVVVDMPWSDD